VQHHHAHLASCLAEHRFEGSALGVIWDGTGLGTDGSSWGGELLVGSAAGCRRLGHLRPFRLPGGDAAIREPRRSALALLWEIEGEGALEPDGSTVSRSFGEAERAVLARMLSTGLRSPRTTSAGRLFDGVSALLGLCERSTFEGQAAIDLEHAAAPEENAPYPLDVVAQDASGDDAAPWVLDWRPTLAAILEEQRRGIPPSTISARFHRGLVEAIVELARRSGESVVALSGGCFQNRLLTASTVARLRESGFRVLLHRRVPPNDGGISLGQVAVASGL
jgi:hydrogenase maturation protein HypF